jgi:phage protein D
MVPSALARCHAARARSWKETTLSDAREVAAQPRVTPVRENLYTLYKKYR